MIRDSLDSIDRRLVEALAGNGRATVTSLAELVGLSGPSVHERLRKLEAAGAIRGYAALADPETVGAGVAAFVALNLGPGLADKARIDAALAAEPCVLEAHEVAGEDCYLLKLRVGSPAELSDAVARLRRLSPTVTTRTTVVLRTVLERPLLAAAAATR
ncbi:MAG TPA: Lrp/AsnC family transcriptional regulator [Actinomycetes bacterium]|jgi:Lrp/AsnC family leucine-responsive transcriptional regulator|nr:Lrp/AsnC family transcriptional regulator [Actinomycetes bacterium]